MFTQKKETGPCHHYSISSSPSPSPSTSATSLSAVRASVRDLFLVRPVPDEAALADARGVRDDGPGIAGRSPPRYCPPVALGPLMARVRPAIFSFRPSKAAAARSDASATRTKASADLLWCNAESSAALAMRSWASLAAPRLRARGGATISMSGSAIEPATDGATSAKLQRALATPQGWQALADGRPTCGVHGRALDRQRSQV